MQLQLVLNKRNPRTFSFLLTLLGFLFLNAAPALAVPIKLSGLFSDHMVVQANEPVVVTGLATPGEPIGVKIGDKKAVAITNERGEFQATVLGGVPAGGPYELSVVGGEEKLVFHDVMAGEVWLCSGQTNMLMNLEQAGLKSDASVIPTDGSIRILPTDFAYTKAPQRAHDKRWYILDKNNADKCSAVPYFFATELKKKLDVPVGIIVSAAPAAPVQSWISIAALNKLQEGRNRLIGFDEEYQLFTNYRKQVREAAGKDADELDIWDKEAKAAYEHGQLAVPTPPAGSLYNGMISPLVPYTIRGVVWYQGEINVTKPDSYERFFSTLMHDWRRRWKKPHMPFLFVQLPPVGDRLETPTVQSKMARLRDAQAKASMLPWTYMVSAVDTIDAESANWHASDKQVIGKRLALMALSTQYNKTYPFKGPTLDTAVAEGNKVRIRFRNATHGLTMKGATLKGFAIAGDDKKLMWAKSSIDGDSVVVWHQQVTKPMMVTYSWADNPNGNLYNGDNLPAIPFRANVTHAQVQ